MPESSYFEQKRMSPTGLVVVIALHAAAITALVMAKGTIFERRPIIETDMYNVPIPPAPEPEPIPKPEPQPPTLPRQSPTVLDRPIPEVERPTTGPTFDTRPFPAPEFDTAPPGGSWVKDPPQPQPLPTPTPVPVRTEAELDPRYAGALQPDYPPSEERMQREGAVRLRVTIGTNGRVASAERLSATSDAFWRATERQALSQWLFRPATIDGRPVEATKTMTVHFRLNDR